MRLPAVHLDKSGKSALDGGLCFLYIRQDASYLTGFAPTGLQRIVGNFRYHLGVGVYRGFAYYLRTATSCTYYTHILSRLKLIYLSIRYFELVDKVLQTAVNPFQPNRFPDSA